MGRMIDLNKFSESQQEAITTNDKHLRIIACAGSGKTTTVAGKVAYLLDPLNQFDIKPENIIAFTYTEKAAGELKNKILNNVGQYRGMANMYIGTIHGWCLKSLQDNEDRKSTRLNSSHVRISYVVFCLKNKKNHY